MTFDEILRMQQTHPRVQLQLMNAQSPRYIQAPAPPGGNTAAAGQFANAMYRPTEMAFQQQRLDQDREASRALSSLQMKTFMAQQHETFRKRQMRSLQDQRNQSYVATLPPGQQAAAAANPEAYTQQAAQSAYQMPNTSAPHKIFQEMGGVQGTGMTFPQFYSEMYKQGNTTNVNVGGMKDSVRKEYLASSKFDDALTHYESLLNEYGTETLPGEAKARLKAAHTNVILSAKEEAKLGALTGPDLDLMKAKFTDPTEVTSSVLPVSTFLSQVKDARAMGKRGRERFLGTLSPEERKAAEKGRTSDWSDAGGGAQWRTK